MIQLIIDNNKYSIPSELHELTITDAIRIHHTIQKYLKSPQPKVNKLNTYSPEFCLGLLENIAGIPETILINVDTDQLHKLTTNHLIPITKKLIYSSFSSISPENNHFLWHNERLFFPKHEPDLSGKTMELAFASAREFCECCDMMNADRILYAPMIIATLCHKKREKYNPHTAKTRAEQMGNITMDIAACVLGMLERTIIYINQEFELITTIRNEKEALNTESFLTTTLTTKKLSSNWCDFLLKTASFSPVQINACQRMKLYDFMQLAKTKFQKAN